MFKLPAGLRRLSWSGEASVRLLTSRLAASLRQKLADVMYGSCQPWLENCPHFCKRTEALCQGNLEVIISCADYEVSVSDVHSLVPALDLILARHLDLGKLSELHW